MGIRTKYISCMERTILLFCMWSLLLLLLSSFSRVWLWAAPETAAHQAPMSLGFSSKNTGVGCYFLLQCMKVKVKSLSPVQLLATPWTAAHQAPPSMGFSRQEYWSGVPLPSLMWSLEAHKLRPCYLCLPTAYGSQDYASKMWLVGSGLPSEPATLLFRWTRDCPAQEERESFCRTRFMRSPVCTYFSLLRTSLMKEELEYLFHLSAISTVK